MEEIESYVYTVPLVDKRNKIVHIQAYGVDTISSNINQADTSHVTSLFERSCKEKICNSYGEVDILVGINYASIQPQREETVGNLALYGNRFGKCVAGSYEKLKGQSLSVVNMCMLKNKGSTLEEFFSIEQMGVSCVPKCGRCGCGRCPIGGKDYTIKEERELKLIEDGLVHQGDHWLAHYPFIKDPSLLPNNRAVVFKMLESTEKRLLKDPKKAVVYNELIEDMIKRKVARKLTEAEFREYKGPVFYLSHHVVVREESKSTPWRLVFNPSAKMFGHIINEYWAKGPNLLTSLLGILIRFREEICAIMGDIKKMFHAVKISVVDQNTHRFLWRNLKIDTSPDDYVMLSVSFGDKPAGGIAIVALRKTAELGEENYPEAARVLKTNVYMDDIIDSLSTYSEAVKITQDIDKVLKLGNFEVKEWIIRNGESMEKKDEVTASGEIAKGINLQKVLGLDWDCDNDNFKFFTEEAMMEKYVIHESSNEDESPEKRILLTKRVILSLVNGIYDPLGLLSPVIIKAKMLLKRLWYYNLGWDDPVPKEILEDWTKFCKDVEVLKEVLFKRCVKPISSVGDPIMITFCDASELAFGACCYFRWQTTNGSFESKLVASKSRVSPTKVQSIVRLEICGAVLGKRLAQFIENETRFRIKKIYFIVDSEVVRSMIQKQSYGFNTFVAVRIGEIQEFTDPSEWFWIESEKNIADWITRGKEAYDIDVGSAWQKGPDFLEEEEGEWPIKGSATEDIPEEKIKNFVYSLKEDKSLPAVIDITRFSSYQRLIGTTARVLAAFKEDVSFKNMLKRPSSEERTAAGKRWIKEVQRSIRGEVESGKFRRLNPCLNEEEIYIVRGRMEYWFEHTYNTKGLILLPYDHRFTLLYALYIHNIGHLGVAATVSKIRRSFWIVNLPKLVKKIRHSCVVCKKLDKILEKQIMAPLPMERLKPSPPFLNTSLDLFGPLEVKGEVNKRTRGKVFGVIFTCLCTRAVYCDVSQNYSTDAFLLVLTRFTSIHGYPKKLFSDPGSQLVSADKELKSIMKGTEKSKDFGVNHGMEWCFSTPDAPWQNGTAESLIKAVKRGIMVTIGQQVVTFSELQTVLFEVANLVNERPIGIHPKNPEDGTYLCPNDLLLGRASNSVPSGTFKNCNNAKRLAFIESLVDAFWKKLSRDYFSSLMIRQKWHTSKRNLKVDDVVLIQDSNSLRGNWKLGRVSNVCPGNDGYVRNVEVKYKNDPAKKVFETVRRAVQKLVLIQPVDEHDD